MASISPFTMIKFPQSLFDLKENEDLKGKIFVGFKGADCLPCCFPCNCIKFFKPLIFFPFWWGMPMFSLLYG
ncbi:MAG: hypothetical protein NZ805_15440, partial [Armatimonadetes bacterium]|nr:hypothetical protein [Armatimonadota bacterium]